MEATQMLINGWMDKDDVIDIYTMEYYSAIENKEILPSAATWMDLEDIVLSEMSNTMIILICGV